MTGGPACCQSHKPPGQRRNQALDPRHGAALCMHVMEFRKWPPGGALEAITLCDGKVQAWETRVMHLATADPPIRTLGDLRQTSDTQLLAVNNVGKKLVVELRRFCPAAGATMFKKSRKSRDDASAALKMIRKVVEAHAPPGAVPEGIVDRGFVKEAEALIEGILAIVKSKEQ